MYDVTLSVLCYSNYDYGKFRGLLELADLVTNLIFLVCFIIYRRLLGSYSLTYLE